MLSPYSDANNTSPKPDLDWKTGWPAWGDLILKFLEEPNQHFQTF